MRRFAACSLAAFALVVATACTEDHPTCYDGDYQACPCDGGVAGLQQCLPTHDGYGDCVCGGPTPGLSDAGDGGDGG
jgi:hypothetical protein